MMLSYSEPLPHLPLLVHKGLPVLENQVVQVVSVVTVSSDTELLLPLRDPPFFPPFSEDLL